MDPLITLELTLIRGDLQSVLDRLIKAQARSEDKGCNRSEIERLGVVIEALDRIDASPAMVPASQFVTHTDTRRN